MKNIYILRHAKSDWSDDNADDKDRILTDRGVDEAKTVAKAFINNKLQFDTIISSPAKRALQTATIVKKNTGFIKEIQVEDCFYFSDLRRILSVIRRQNDENNTILIVGHNPLWSNLVLYLTGNRMTMDTGCAAILTSNIDKWDNFDNNAFKLELYINPKKIK